MLTNLVRLRVYLFFDSKRDRKGENGREWRMEGDGKEWKRKRGVIIIIMNISPFSCCKLVKSCYDKSMTNVGHPNHGELQAEVIL